MTSNDLTTTFKKAKQYLEDNNIHYLRANIEVPRQAVIEAWSIYKKGLFIPHRSSDSRGWSSCTLYGESMHTTTINKERQHTHDWTELVDYAPIMTNWLKNVFPNNGSYTRCRYMLLEPGGYIKRHTDTNQWKEGMPLKNDICSAINIAFNQPKNCYLRNSETKHEVPFTERAVMWYNNGPFHEAANYSKEPRIHFIVHGGGNEERMKLFIESFKKEHPNVEL